MSSADTPNSETHGRKSPSPLERQTCPTLWGAYPRGAGMSAASLQRIIQSKLFPRETRDINGTEPTDAISLISYRINFHVALYSPASDNLRYIVGINDECTFLQILQPSEPSLAFAAGTSWDTTGCDSPLSQRCTKTCPMDLMTLLEIYNKHNPER